MAAPKELFKQKVNVSKSLSDFYVKKFKHLTGHPINKHLLSVEDLGKTLEYQGRNFTIHGMTESEHVIVTEIVDGVTFYWETTSSFIQMRLGRFYDEWKTLPNGLKITSQKVYELNDLYLPNPKPSRKKKEVLDELPEEPMMESYVEDEIGVEEEI